MRIVQKVRKKCAVERRPILASVIIFRICLTSPLRGFSSPTGSYLVSPILRPQKRAGELRFEAFDIYNYRG